MRYNFVDNDATVVISSELTFADHPLFREVLDRLLVAKGPALVVDLSALEFIDSAGLGMLLIMRDEAKKLNRDVILRKPHGAVERMFAVTSFSTLFKIEA